ncbi:MAG TPA: hypothetical protein P5044_07405, partial [bacterium]|nr:hypothetical protein [bacterium]
MREDKKRPAILKKIDSLQDIFHFWLRADNKKTTLAIGFFFSVLLAFLSIPDSARIDYPVSEKDIGSVLKYSVRANRDYSIINEEKTKQNRLQAEKSVPLYFQYVEGWNGAGSVKTAFSYFRTAFKSAYSTGLKNGNSGIPDEFKDLALLAVDSSDDLSDALLSKDVMLKMMSEKSEFSRMIGFPLPDELFDILLRNGFS